MGDWPLQRVNRVSTVIPLTGVATSTTANTKSAAWAALTAATPYGGYLELISYADVAAGDFLTDIAIGAAGAEVILVNNLYSELVATGFRSYTCQYVVPIYIPAGTRISAKAQCSVVGGSTVTWAGVLRETDMFSGETQLAKCTTLGATTSDSGGTSIDPGASIGTKGAWVEFSAALPYRTRSLVAAFGGNRDTARVACSWAVDIGVGAAGSEVAIIENYPINVSDSGDVIFPKTTPPINVNIPLGTRLSMRASSSTDSAGNRLYDAIIYAFN